MTIESDLHSIAESLKLIADLLTVKVAHNAQVPVAPAAVAAVAAAVDDRRDPVVNAPAVAVQPVMPAAPVFTQAAPTPTVTAPSAAATPAAASPFSDKQSMMDFVLSSYKALGAEKGARIQDVLTTLGFRNINDVPQDKWAELKAGIEALKG